MKKLQIFTGGLATGIVITFLVIYLFAESNKTNDGLNGLSIFPKEGNCLTTLSKNKSCEIQVFQVIAPNAALATIKYFSDKKLYGGETYRDYDVSNNVTVLLINYDDKTYYDEQKIDISKKCAKQIGTYQYNTKGDFEKTVPVVVIE